MLSNLCLAQQTTVKGKVTDAETGLPVPAVSILFAGTHSGTSTDSLGKFNLSASGSFAHIVVSAVGYQSASKTIVGGTENTVQVKLTKNRTQLKEVAIRAITNKRYRNKDNPAVELIKRVIARKDSNRAANTAYLQYDQYERVSLTAFDIPPVLVNNFLFKPYKFMLDTIKGKLSMQGYLSEKRYHEYLRRDPEKTIQVLEAQKENNVIKFIDTSAVNIYLNRLYGPKLDIYENNIFIVARQLLSPISNHSYDYYKFFITDTIRSAKDTLVELSFVPRNKGDLLFEGHLLVSLNNYAVTSCELNVNSQINLNFLRSLKVVLDFEKLNNGRYYLTKSDSKVDFGILKNKGLGMTGNRTIYYTNYQVNQPRDSAFYKGKNEQVLADLSHPDSSYWAVNRPDTLPKQDTRFYQQAARLEKMKSYKWITWIGNTLNGGYADVGPVQMNTNDFFSYSSIEGLRLGVGGRTTAKFNKTLYFEGYVADGTKDHQFKYNATMYISLNQTPSWRYPNNYFKFLKQYDVGLPGDDQSNGNFRTPISSSLQTGATRYYFYSTIYRFDYVKEFDNHFSFDIGFFNQNQRAAGVLSYTLNDPARTIVDHLTASVATLTLRYAPHEQLYQQANDRRTIRNQYPVFTLRTDRGISGLFGSTNNYTSLSATMTKRVYLSQLGFADVTLLAGDIIGQVPYPLLSIASANQSLVYSVNGYNQMKTLEFISDHYAGFNITQQFGGFFLNKIPLIDRLKLREFLTFKVLYGGLRDENNPALNPGLYTFPVATSGTTGTYSLNSTPYTEAGVGIGNIFKIVRVDGIRRFTYLDHPGVSKYGVKLTLHVGL